MHDLRSVLEFYVLTFRQFICSFQMPTPWSEWTWVCAYIHIFIPSQTGEERGLKIPPTHPDFFCLMCFTFSPFQASMWYMDWGALSVWSPFTGLIFLYKKIQTYLILFYKMWICVDKYINLQWYCFVVVPPLIVYKAALWNDSFIQYPPIPKWDLEYLWPYSSYKIIKTANWFPTYIKLKTKMYAK